MAVGASASNAGGDEQAVDEQLSALRVRLLTDTALASATTDLRKVGPEERPVCP